MITVHKGFKAGLSEEELQKLTEGAQEMSLEDAQNAVLPLFEAFKGLGRLVWVFQAAIKADRERKELEEELTEANKTLKKLLSDAEELHEAFEETKEGYKDALGAYSGECRVERERLDREIAGLKRERDGLGEEIANRLAKCERDCKARENVASEAVRRAREEVEEMEKRRDGAQRDFQLLQQRWGIG